MRGFFNMDGPIFQALGRLADLIILNLIFVLTCIPIITIGASITALYSITLKMVKDEESYIVKGYFKAFKDNFKQSTIIWLVFLVMGILLFMDFRIFGSMGEGMSKVFLTLLLAIVLLFFLGAVYVFPLQAKFYNTIKGTVMNAFLMALGNLPYTIVIVVIILGSAFITFFNGTTLYYGLLFWFLAGFSVIAHLTSRFFMKAFDPYIAKVQASEEKSDSDISDDFSSVFKNLQPQDVEEQEE